MWTGLLAHTSPCMLPGFQLLTGSIDLARIGTLCSAIRRLRVGSVKNAKCKPAHKPVHGLKLARFQRCSENWYRSWEWLWRYCSSCGYSNQHYFPKLSLQRKETVFARSLVIGLPVALGRSRDTPGSGSCVGNPCVGSTLLAGVHALNGPLKPCCVQSKFMKPTLSKHGDWCSKGPATLPRVFLWFRLLGKDETGWIRAT